MILTNDKTLEECCPEGVVLSDFLAECEVAVNRTDLQSDEFLTEDEELANGERRKNQRNPRILNTNSVIKVKEKLWRSNRVSVKLDIL
jgi:hypothetical protein